jgi:YD repeat-containing protein
MVTRQAMSGSGRILRSILTDGTESEQWTYGYDAAGRLTDATLFDETSATVPRHDLTFAFAQTSTCGVNLAAGRTGNRTGSHRQPHRLHRRRRRRHPHDGGLLQPQRGPAHLDHDHAGTGECESDPGREPQCLECRL